MIIEQTIEVPDSRRIFFDLPPDLPVGMAKVELIFTPLSDAPQTKSNGKIRLTKKMIDEMLQGEALRSLSGILHTDMTVEEIHEERLAIFLQ